MIQLEAQFTSGVDGFSANPLTYTQLARTQRAAIYERSRDGKPKDYEVFIIKVDLKGKQIFQQVLEDDRERYPTASQFGFIAWSFNNKDVAFERFKELNEELNAPEESKVEKIIVIPSGEFSVAQLADHNKVSYIEASAFVKENLDKTIKFVRQFKKEGQRGKPANFYTKI